MRVIRLNFHEFFKALGGNLCARILIIQKCYSDNSTNILRQERTVSTSTTHSHRWTTSQATNWYLWRRGAFEEMDEYNEIVFYLLAWLAFWLIIEIKILFTCGMRIYLNDETLKKKSRVRGKLPFFCRCCLSTYDGPRAGENIPRRRLKLITILLSAICIPALD